MKKKKIRNLKGFTLIELLAVIVILAVIALIAVPQILKILNKARLSAAEDTTYGIIKSAESYVTNFMLENNGTLPSEELVFNCDENGCNLKTPLTDYNLEGLDKLDFKGTKPTSGTIRISNNGNNITTTDLVINNFVCGYIGGESICIEKGKTELKENGTVIYFNPETNEQCTDYVEANSDTENKSGCMKWYVFNDSEDSMAYNLLLDHNTTTVNAWDNWNKQLILDTMAWNSNLNKRIITANEIVAIVQKANWDLSVSSDFFSFETLSSLEPSSYSQPSKYGWLFDRTNSNCTNYGCLNNSQGLETYGYWTSNFIPSSVPQSAWFVGYRGTLNWDYITSMNRGLRPVITVEKSKIS